MRNFVIGALALGLATISSKPALSESVKQLTGEVCRLTDTAIGHGKIDVFVSGGILKISKGKGVDKFDIIFYNKDNNVISSYSDFGNKDGKVCSFNLDEMPDFYKVSINRSFFYPLRNRENFDKLKN